MEAIASFMRTTTQDSRLEQVADLSGAATYGVNSALADDVLP